MPASAHMKLVLPFASLLFFLCGHAVQEHTRVLCCAKRSSDPCNPPKIANAGRESSLLESLPRLIEAGRSPTTSVWLAGVLGSSRISCPARLADHDVWEPREPQLRSATDQEAYRRHGSGYLSVFCTYTNASFTSRKPSTLTGHTLSHSACLSQRERPSVTPQTSGGVNHSQ